MKLVKTVTRLRQANLINRLTRANQAVVSILAVIN
jgi:hypothetical protein